jgi:integrase
MENSKLKGAWTNPALGRVLFREWFAEWQRTSARLRPNTEARDEWLFRQRFWLPAIKAAGLDGLRIHDLRHTAVALWIAAGANPKEVAARAGHASVCFTLDRYGHLYPEVDLNLREARWTAVLAGGRDRARTCDLVVVSDALVPTELHAHYAVYGASIGI